eukprot:SAG11_NODE_18196_length_497_cov_1.429648_2_plen_27_part_01
MAQSNATEDTSIEGQLEECWWLVDGDL